MNDEEILNAFLLSNIVEIITQEEFEDVKKAIKNILKRNKELEEEIHKKDILINASAEIVRNSILVSKIKEIVDECIPRGKNIITGIEEYQTNVNANSYLAQEVLKLLEGK